MCVINLKRANPKDGQNVLDILLLIHFSFILLRRYSLIKFVETFGARN